MAASDRMPVRSPRIAVTQQGHDQHHHGHAQLLDTLHDAAHPSKPYANRSRLLRPMTRLLHKARAATLGKRAPAQHRHLPGDANQHASVTSTAINSPVEAVCNHSMPASTPICSPAQQATIDPELLIESDSSSLSIHCAELSSSPVSMSAVAAETNQLASSSSNSSNERPRHSIDSQHSTGNDRRSVHSAHTVAVCTRHPYAENGRTTVPAWQQSAQQLPLAHHDHHRATIDDEPVLVTLRDENGHGRRSLGRRAWYGLRQQIARALPHLSRSHMGADPSGDAGYAAQHHHMARGRSRTMPPMAAAAAAATDEEALVRQRRHISDSLNSAALADMLRPPPYNKGALYPFAWAPNRTSVTVSVTVSRHTTPCGSGCATPNPQSPSADSPALTPWRSASNLRANPEHQQYRHSMSSADQLLASHSVVVERVPGVMAADGRTYPLPPSSLKPRRPFRHAPVAAPTCQAPEVSTALLAGQQQQQQQQQQPRTRERSSSASAFTYTTSGMASTLATLRINVSQQQQHGTRPRNTTAPSSPVLGRDDPGRPSLLHRGVDDAHKQVDALLHFSQALGRAILELQDALVLWEQPAAVRALARRPEMYAYTQWPETVQRQLAESEAAVEPSATTHGGAGGDFAPGALLSGRAASSPAIVLHQEGASHGSDADHHHHHQQLLLPNIVRQLVIQADQALLRAHTTEAKALLKQAVDPLSNRVALAKTIMASADAQHEAEDEQT
ncbi:hypothetical protein SYNPS1DRAFT_28905 [Syncephalis pseudoplumigaleata]|uniref:Uncharacterized protein n=1 Tax=Syncephalis pseudoplumigaleata TaxID=1712513 RepID=A0A4P9Z0Y1_9FUNG|nr:hypothetical protein SYNPS1DRAFT_28905 [Syncephalis pseudoplumigaleata]|eukprot:RKP25361.1 hypothetical protein SYNPS1DRAFT_28905 [Syncephalis pseudoplumigaleata]